MNVSANASLILAAVVTAALTSKEVAANTGLALPVVTGSLAGLKKLGLVEVNEGAIALTDAGRDLVAPVQQVAVEVVETPVEKTNKAAVAKSIFAEMFGHAARKEILAAFQQRAGLTKRGSETYFYNLTKAAKG